MSLYRFVGVSAYDQSGYSVASAGDVDGDGKDDLIIGARGAGESYLITAADLAAADAADGLSDGVVDLGSIASQPGSYKFNGANAGDSSGYSVASAGDVDGDGKSDLIIGAFQADGGGADSGESYLITAADLAAADAADGVSDGVVDLGSIASQPGSYKFNGANAGDYSGVSVASAGDVDGDGKDDLIIGAYRSDGGGSDSGESYLITAADLAAADAADGLSDGVVDLGSIASQPGSYKFNGANAGDSSGYSVASAGDVDGDGKSDLIIGAFQADGGGADSGESYLITAADLAAADAADGLSDGVVDLGSIASQPGSYKFNGANAGDSSGCSVASAGDVDGDGKDDLIIGARGAGESYLITAADLAAADAADGLSDGVVDLGSIASQPGSYKFNGANAGDSSGYSVASAGDVDGDGKSDLIIGAFQADGGGADSGESYLITAADLAAADAADGVSDGVVDLGSIASQPGSYKFNGANAGDYSGVSVASAGDVDGDGKDDLIIGAYRSDGGGSDSGESYLITAADLAAADAADGLSDGVVDLEYIRDIMAPAVPVVGAVGLTNDDTPTITGTAEANATVTVLLDGSSQGTATADGSGNWSFTLSSQSDGSYSLTATATDAAGNTSSASSAEGLTIDTAVPAVPVVGAVGLTNDDTPTITGTAEANATVTVLLDGSSQGTATADGSGNWSFTLSSQSDGSYSLTATATDAAGNTSSASSAEGLIIDTAVPVITDPGAISIDENAAVASSVVSLAATDTNALSGWVITAGNGLGGFVIDSDTGVITVADMGVLDFETNPAFDLDVVVGDGVNQSAALTVSITLNDLNEAPIVTSAMAVSVAENITGVVYTVTASDPDAGATLSYALGGADAALFGINASSGAVTFIAPPNFEAPSDSGGNNIYDITVTASDGGLISAEQAVVITVVDVNEAPPPAVPSILPPQKTPNAQGGFDYILSAVEQLSAAQGSAGIDQITANFGINQLPQGIENVVLAGADDIGATGNALGNVFYGNIGENEIFGLDGNDALFGNNGNDRLFGNVGSDTSFGGQGSDTIYGNQDSDFIYGNQDNDLLYGGQGDDVLFGGQGNDAIFGNNGNDRLFGNVDSDSIDGGDGNDLMHGGQGNDLVRGASGVDTSFGGQGSDTIYGNQDSDFIYGNQDNDLLYGGQGDDVLFGGQGNDAIFGDNGNDRLNGNLGDDSLTGGEGADTFIFTGRFGNDVITDFSAEDGDQIVVSQPNLVAISQVEGSILMLLGEGGSILLLGVSDFDIADLV